MGQLVKNTLSVSLVRWWRRHQCWLCGEFGESVCNRSVFDFLTVYTSAVQFSWNCQKIKSC